MRRKSDGAQIQRRQALSANILRRLASTLTDSLQVQGSDQMARIKRITKILFSVAPSVSPPLSAHLMLTACAASIGDYVLERDTIFACIICLKCMHSNMHDDEHAQWSYTVCIT